MSIKDDPFKKRVDEGPASHILKSAHQKNNFKHWRNQPQQQAGHSESSGQQQQCDAGLGKDNPKRDPNEKFRNR